MAGRGFAPRRLESAAHLRSSPFFSGDGRGIAARLFSVLGGLASSSLLGLQASLLAVLNLPRICVRQVVGDFVLFFSGAWFKRQLMGEDASAAHLRLFCFADVWANLAARLFCFAVLFVAAVCSLRCSPSLGEVAVHDGEGAEVAAGGEADRPWVVFGLAGDGDAIEFAILFHAGLGN